MVVIVVMVVVCAASMIVVTSPWPPPISIALPCASDRKVIAWTYVGVTEFNCFQCVLLCVLWWVHTVFLIESLSIVIEIVPFLPTGIKFSFVEMIC